MGRGDLLLLLAKNVSGKRNCLLVLYHVQETFYLLYALSQWTVCPTEEGQQ